jgi:hypothetical protein
MRLRQLQHHIRHQTPVTAAPASGAVIRQCLRVVTVMHHWSMRGLAFIDRNVLESVSHTL